MDGPTIVLLKVAQQTALVSHPFVEPYQPHIILTATGSPTFSDNTGTSTENRDTIDSVVDSGDGAQTPNHVAPTRSSSAHTTIRDTGARQNGHSLRHRLEGLTDTRRRVTRRIRSRFSRDRDSAWTNPHVRESPRSRIARQLRRFDNLFRSP